MNTRKLNSCTIYDSFESPKEYHDFIKQKQQEGFEEIKSHGLDRRFLNQETKEFMRARCDAFDGKVTIMKKGIANTP